MKMISRNIHSAGLHHHSFKVLTNSLSFLKHLNPTLRTQLKQYHYITEEVTHYTYAGMAEVKDKTPKQNTNVANTSDAKPDVSKMLNHYGTYFFSWFEAFS